MFLAQTFFTKNDLNCFDSIHTLYRLIRYPSFDKSSKKIRKLTHDHYNDFDTVHSSLLIRRNSKRNSLTKALRINTNFSSLPNKAIMPAPQYGALGASYTVARGLQGISLISIIGMTANFIAQMVSSKTNPPNVLIGTISVVSALPSPQFVYRLLTPLRLASLSSTAQSPTSSSGTATFPSSSPLVSTPPS